jgi:hypothetical protein
MMKMDRTCDACGKPIAGNATTCPHCGRVYTSSGTKMLAIIAVFVLLVIIIVMLTQ